MKIYTKTGDLGETSTFRGKRISKSNIRIKANGTVDELNAAIGLVIASLDYGEVKEQIIRIQNELFDAGADISLGAEVLDISKYKIQKAHIDRLEKEIDEMEKELSPLKNFILPGGSELGAFVHLARAICRRAERELVAVHQVEKTNPFLISFLNRLSDWLFVTARYINKLKGIPESKYISK